MPSAAYVDVRRYLIGAIVFNTIIAAALTAFGKSGFGQNLVYSQCIGLLTYASIDLPRRVLWPQGGPPLAPVVGLALAAALVGWFGGSLIAGTLLGNPRMSIEHDLNAMLGYLALTAGAGLSAVLYFWSRERLAESERAAAEARLKLLQAQIEPHFLFNTLANLQTLIAIDPQRAQIMLGHLDRYLRATLASTRKDKATLAEEFALLSAYLGILAIRMGARLAYELELPPALADATLPPMLLQPLAENAVKHGLEPKMEGGRLRIAAREESGRLVLEVEDSGLGLTGAATAGTGVGLAHVKERLAAVYGGAASAEIGEQSAGGVRVTLRLPLERG